MNDPLATAILDIEEMGHRQSPLLEPQDRWLRQRDVVAVLQALRSRPAPASAVADQEREALTCPHCLEPLNESEAAEGPHGNAWHPQCLDSWREEP